MLSSTVMQPQRPRGATDLDWGRIVMVPVCLGLWLGSAVQLTSVLGEEDGRAGAVITLTTALLAGLFNVLLTWAYLRRGPARATSTVRLALLTAPLATFLPFALPFLGTGTATKATILLGDVLLVLGLSWSVWAIRCLDRSLSVVPQARELVDHGPYALVRHPLYLGEIVAILGLALTLGGPLPIVGWLLLVGLQCYRSVQEESLLDGSLPGYREYRLRTTRVLPGVF